MTGHDDGKRIAAKRLPDRAGRARHAQLRGKLPVCQGLAGPDGTGRLVDPPVKRRHGIHVERDARQVDGLATQQARDGFDRLLHPGWRRGFCQSRKAREQSRARLGVAILGQLDAADPPGTPGEAAAADGRVEKRDALFHDASLRRVHRRCPAAGLQPIHQFSTS
jgi:hypothetical protein